MNAATRNCFAILNAVSESDLVERSNDEIAGSEEVPMENRSGATRNAYVPGLDDLERDQRRVEQVPQFV